MSVSQLQRTVVVVSVQRSDALDEVVLAVDDTGGSRGRVRGSFVPEVVGQVLYRDHLAIHQAHGPLHDLLELIA